jgi:hypothetical protein
MADPVQVQEGDELRDFDPCAEGGGGPCERCGRRFEPWVYARLCQACVWDEAGAA